MCKESGLKALSGGHNDIRDIETEAARGNKRARLALDVLIHQARHWNRLLLSATQWRGCSGLHCGAGENRAALREAICANLDQLGIVLDPEKNRTPAGNEFLISAAESRLRVFVIPANEELVVAREVKRYSITKNQPFSLTHHPSPIKYQPLSTLNSQPSTNVWLIKQLE